jgi:cytochrome c
MRKILPILVALAAFCAGSTVAVAQNAHTPEQAKALVEKAAVYLKSADKQAALAAFSDPKGPWVEGDLYLVVMDATDGKLTTLAHGANKAVIGKPQIDATDAEGKSFNHDTAAALAKGNDVWITYKWPNPAIKKIASKKMYLLKSGDVVIGAGVYE